MPFNLHGSLSIRTVCCKILFSLIDFVKKLCCDVDPCVLCGFDTIKVLDVIMPMGVIRSSLLNGS